MKITYTHVGWFGLAPVLIADPHDEIPTLPARWGLLGEILFDVSELVFLILNFFLPPDRQGVSFTAKALDKPVIVELPDAD